MSVRAQALDEPCQPNCSNAAWQPRVGPLTVAWASEGSTKGGRDIDKVNAVSEIMAPHLHAVPAEFAWQPLSVSQSSLSQWFRVLT